MKENFSLFPGWMRTDVVYGQYNYINIWERKIYPLPLINTQYIIGHSVGSVPALLCWAENPNTTLILLNPLLPKRSLFNILFRWIKMLFLAPKGTAGYTKSRYIFRATLNAIYFIKVDLLSLIQKIPKGKLIIIRGRNDTYFCDLESVKILKNNSISFFELDGVGHSWDFRVSRFIENHIK